MAALLDNPALLEKVETRYRAFEDLLAPLDSWQLTTPGVVGEWSIKDVLAHLTVWQKRLLTILEAACQGREQEASSVAQMAADDVERLNQTFYAAARARPLREVWAVFHASYVQVKQAIAALSQKVQRDPERFAWLDEAALQRLIAGSTYEHLEEHMLPIHTHAWLME